MAGSGTIKFHFCSKKVFAQSRVQPGKSGAAKPQPENASHKLDTGPRKTQKRKKGTHRCVEDARNDFSSELLSCSRSINVSALSQRSKTATSQKKRTFQTTTTEWQRPQRQSRAKTIRAGQSCCALTTDSWQSARHGQRKWPRQAKHRALMRAWQWGMNNNRVGHAHTHHSRYKTSAA